MPATAKRPAKQGRPSDVPTVLMRQITPATDGRPARTVHDVLVDNLRLGVDVKVAAAKARVSPATVYDWLAAGGRIAQQVDNGERTPDDLTPAETATMRFGLEAIEAVADAEITAVVNLQSLAAGATRKRVTRTVGKDDDGAAVVEMTETLPPSFQANELLLARRFAERWVRRAQIEVTAADADAAPPSPLPALLERLEAMERRRVETAAALGAAVQQSDG